MSERPMSRRRVVVTGLGIISPIGNDIATAWDHVLKGVSGIGPVTHFDASGYATRIAGQVRGFEPAQFGLAKRRNLARRDIRSFRETRALQRHCDGKETEDFRGHGFEVWDVSVGANPREAKNASRCLSDSAKRAGSLNM